ncbi:protein kinase [Cladorrhinum sp. PSN332]|nr:protein kinase [Cladorrhinum sp. PSN332]
MADVLSIAGLALGATSLAFELFSGCVKGYNLLLEANQMPDTCRFLLVRLRIEKEKLVGWAVLAGISEEEKTMSPLLRLNRHTVLDALRELEVLLLDVQKLDERYNLRLVVDTHSPELIRQQTVPEALPGRLGELEEKALGLFERTRKLPKKLRWAAFHKEKFEELLAHIAVLNDSMMQFLESHDRQRHFKMQEVMLMQILHANTRINDLFDLVKSFQANSKQRSESLTDHAKGEGHEGYERRTVALTRFKALKLAVETERTDTLEVEEFVTGTPELAIHKLKLTTQSNDNNTLGSRRSSGMCNDKSVWVEWRNYQPIHGYGSDDEGEESHEPPRFVQDRISKMAKLLRDREKPEEFRVPHCLGYVRDLSECRLGFVFLSDASLKHSIPVSLLDLLSDRRKPSLTTRIRIAKLISSSIWYLHSTEWLHKGLRSENIVFPVLDPFSSVLPILCGFDYSRPADIDETTERPIQNLWHDLYRHPKTQFDSPREGRNGFRKIYDIYSLGVVLTEIALWKPVHTILGIDTTQRLKAATVKGVQTGLLAQDKLDDVEAEAGRVFASVVRACLSGEFGNDGTLGDANLQLVFWEKVVDPLEGIAV